MKRQPPSELHEEKFLSPATRLARLSESVGLGAQLMLQKAIKLEITEFPGRHPPWTASGTTRATGPKTGDHAAQG